MSIRTLLVLHVLGAVAGFGPTFAFGILGQLSSQMPGPGAVALMKGMAKIEKVAVRPTAYLLQPVTGALLIFAGPWNEIFWSQEWLTISVVLYVLSFAVATVVQNPALHRMIEIAEAEPGPPVGEFLALARRTAKAGPVLTILLVAIVVLMVAKPGA